jgi:uncharacterized small protein (DUF1192 family)|tara:strand:- start:183 stop:392 length:210 start_codon:yes stop_codon:yes gene_type:complete
LKLQHKNQSIDVKFILNIISLIGAVGWGWWEMESRITALEMKIEQQNKMQALQDEIERIKNQQQFSELK